MKLCLCYTKDNSCDICDSKSSKMIDICSCCNCCNGCSSERQLSTYFRYSFSKKLLVAIALVVIIAMFITPTEARAVDRRRHKHAVSMAQTKDSPRPNSRHSLLNRRHQKRLENLTLPTKDMKRPKNARTEMYKRETKKIFRKMKNTKSFFRFEKEPELKEYRETPPNWLPTVNFVEVHFHEYNASKERKHGVKLETKFKYVMPKLYKSLVEYETLFKVYQNMELNFPDTLINSYQSKRKALLENTISKLYSTIGEVRDSMMAVNMSVRQYKQKDFSILPNKVTMSECLRYDYLAFRGYGNLLNNWVSELRCLKRNKHPAIQKLCDQWEEKLKEKKTSMNNRQHTMT